MNKAVIWRKITLSKKNSWFRIPETGVSKEASVSQEEKVGKGRVVGDKL